MKAHRFLFFTLVLLGGSIARAQNTPPQVRLTLPEAARRAEVFITQNGYTNAPPIADHSKLVLEWTDRYKWNLKPDKTWDYDKILSYRKGSLEPTACAWTRDKATKYAKAMWLIAFHTPRSTATGKGRAVWVSESGDEVWMFHEDARLAKFLPLRKLPLRP